MSGGYGAGMPKIIRDADALLDKLKAYPFRDRLAKRDRELMAETETVIAGLKDHAAEQYQKGREAGKAAVLNRIRDKLDPDRQEYSSSIMDRLAPGYDGEHK